MKTAIRLVSLLSAVMFARALADPSKRPDVGPFFRVEDPREAAKALRIEIERSGHTLGEPLWASLGRSFKEVVHLEGGDFVPDEDDYSVLGLADSLLNSGDSSTTMMCLIQMRPEITVLGDIVFLLERGVRIYKFVHRATAIAAVPVEALPEFRRHRFIRWVGDFKPRYKYRPEVLQAKETATSIYSLDGDRPEFRRDLREAGAVGVEYVAFHEGYGAQTSPEDVERIAKLWWVEIIVHAPPESVN